MENAIEMVHVTKKFKETVAVNGVTVSLEKGKIHGIIGRNGSGKTVLFKCICGLFPVTEGQITVLGQKMGDGKRVPKGVGAIIETPGFLPNCSGYQNLRYLMELSGRVDREKIRSAIALVGLDPDSKKHVGKYSLGMRQRLGIAMALVSNPDFIILDEPTNGLDPQGIVEIRELLLRLNRERGITILISSHILSELSKLATCYGFIEKGVLIKEISAEELERSCRKSIHITVSSTSRLPLVLERQLMLYDYKIFSETEAELYCDVKISDLAAALTEGSIDLLKVSERDEDLEGYFINLVGGAK